MDIVDKLLSNIKVNAAGCFEWQMHRVTYGYGGISVNGKARLAHRVSFEVFRGPIPNGMYVCHKCDNPPCINPSHLFVGTQLDNMRDAAEKNRVRHGDKNGRAKLTGANVIEVCRRYSDGEMVDAIASWFGVSRSAIYDIVNGKKWAKTSKPVIERRPIGSPGMKNPMAKLTDDDVREIRSLNESGASTRALARMFGIGSTQSHEICSRKSWKHIS